MTPNDPGSFSFAMNLKNSDSDDEVFDEKKLYSWRNSSKGKKEVFSIARTAQSQIFILSQSPYDRGPTYGCHRFGLSKKKSGPSWNWKVPRYENERYWPKWNSRLNVESTLWTVNMLKVSTRKFIWRPDSETSADKVKWFTLNLRKKGNNTFFKSSRSSKVWSWELGCQILRNWREVYGPQN